MSQSYPVCPRCRTNKRPLVDGKRTCTHCTEYIRVENKRRRAVKREWETAKLRSLGVVPLEEYVAELKATRETQRALLVSFAEHHGRLPTLGEAAAVLDRSVIAARHIRIEAFDLPTRLPARGPGLRIPYPVPAEFRAATREAVNA